MGQDDFAAFQAKMEKAGLSQPAIDAFRLNYEQLVGGATGMASPLICHPYILVSRRILDAWAWPTRGALITTGLLQVPEGDIEPVKELPHLKDLKDASKADVKVSWVLLAMLAMHGSTSTLVLRRRGERDLDIYVTEFWACAEAPDADGSVQAQRWPGHVHGPGKGQEPAGGEGWQDIPGPDSGADQVHQETVWLQGGQNHTLLLVCLGQQGTSSVAQPAGLCGLS